MPIDNEDYVRNCIRLWVWSGFYDQADVTDMLPDVLEPGQAAEPFAPAIEAAFQAKAAAEAEWPDQTDCDRLYAAFRALDNAGICALHKTGYEMSDGFPDIAETMARAPAGHYRGYCFYHGQDVERAIDSGTLSLAFGDLEGNSEATVVLGQEIEAALTKAGFKVRWDGTARMRPEFPIAWQKRYNLT